MAKKSKRYRSAPEAPPDAAGYTLVRTKEGVFWRRKRGTIKKAELNSSFKRNAEATSLASPAAKRILDKLDPYVHGLETGRFIANVSARLKKAFNKTGKMDFSFMNDYEIQPWHPLGNLLQQLEWITEKNNELTITIPIHDSTIKRLNREITDYYFEAILLWGQPDKARGLKVESDTSALYGFGQKTTTKCKLTVTLPTQKLPWMIFLKLSCLEGKELADHPRYYGMKVVRVGVK